MTRNIRTVNYGLETISVFGPKIWSIVPDNLKMFTTEADLKNISGHGSQYIILVEYVRYKELLM